MNRLSIAFSLLSAMSCNGFAWAGPGVSGGGQGIVCRNDQGSVVSARLLDLVEAEDYFILPIQDQPADRSYLDIAREYALKLDTSVPVTFPTSLETVTNGSEPPIVTHEINPYIIHVDPNTYLFGQVSRIDANKKLIPGEDFVIPPVGDSHPRVLPAAKGCSIEQIAIYTDGDDQVHFVGGIWNKLSNVHKAALLVHEALYRSLRDLGDSNSDRARETVAYLFSGMRFDWILNGLPQQYLDCWSDDAETSFQFVVFPDPSSESYTALFLVYDGNVMLTRTETKLSPAFFAPLFGHAAPAQSGDLVTFKRIANPLLDRPTYAFGEYIDSKTGVMRATIEAISGVGGKDPKHVACNQHLSAITESGGSVSVGPVGHY